MPESSDALERQLQLARETFLKQHDEKHDAEQKALDTALDAERHRLTAHREAHEAAHLAHEKLHEAFSEAHQQRHESENRALEAATKSLDKRLDAMNEFRDQLREQAASFVRVDAFDAFKDERRHALEVLDTSLDNRIEGLRALIATEREERRAAEGVKKGMSQTTAIIVGAIGLAATVISIVVVLANFLTTA